MIPDAVAEAIAGPWALTAMSLLVLGDAFFVVVPGEIAVTALGALAISTGAPSLWAVIGCAALAAAAGDLLCYGIGRWVGLDRWRWMRTGAVERARHWARGRLESGTAVVLFTARFIPFARLAINLVAGATRIPLPRYAGLVALAATGWAAYQAAIGALVAAFLPGGPVVAILVAVVVAVAIGALIDLGLRRRSKRRSPSPESDRPTRLTP
jgi:membrane protein DedA with SNARE-associated domain